MRSRGSPAGSRSSPSCSTPGGPRRGGPGSPTSPGRRGRAGVDSVYEQVSRELLTYMIQDPQSIQRATYLIWVAHNLERIADRVTNICERVVFMVTGHVQELNVSKY